MFINKDMSTYWRLASRQTEWKGLGRTGGVLAYEGEFLNDSRHGWGQRTKSMGRPYLPTIRHGEK